MSLALSVCLLLQGPVSAPAGSPANPWSAVQFMVGEWTGESDGEPGKGTVKRSYRFVLGDKFLHEQNVSIYPPQPKNEKGEVHEHWSFISYAYEVYSKARFKRVGQQAALEGIAKPGPLATDSSLK